MRGYGRSTSPSYKSFIKALDQAKSNITNQTMKDKLRMFDFDFKDWPVDFNVNDLNG